MQTDRVRRPVFIFKEKTGYHYIGVQAYYPPKQEDKSNVYQRDGIPSRG